MVHDARTLLQSNAVSSAALGRGLSALDPFGLITRVTGSASVGDPCAEATNAMSSASNDGVCSRTASGGVTLRRVLEASASVSFILY